MKQEEKNNNQCSDELDAQLNKCCGFNVKRVCGIVGLVGLVACIIGFVIFWDDVAYRKGIIFAFICCVILEIISWGVSYLGKHRAR